MTQSAIERHLLMVGEFPLLGGQSLVVNPGVKHEDELGDECKQQYRQNAILRKDRRGWVNTYLNNPNHGLNQEEVLLEVHRCRIGRVGASTAAILHRDLHAIAAHATCVSNRACLLMIVAWLSLKLTRGCSRPWRRPRGPREARSRPARQESFRQRAAG